jgi:hypothetical protein
VDRDTRHTQKVCFDTLERTYNAEDVKVAMDGQAGDLIVALVGKWDLKIPKTTHCHTTPDMAWVTGQEIHVEHLKPFVYGTPSHLYFIRRQFVICADGTHGIQVK